MSGAGKARACAVCGAVLRGPVAGFRFDCPACGYACADLPVTIAALHGALREDDRAQALAALRARNFATVLDRLAACGAAPPRALLEVGCAHGWFLDAARARGYAAAGIEPDGPIGAQAAARGHPVSIGYFPAALAPGARYDVVAFNDVFEHLPDPRAALRDVRGALAPGGVLAINLPSSRGAIYRVANALRAAGWRGPHDRLWQVGFPSPHLSYFHPDALARLAAREGFAEVDRVELPSVVRAGLWQRLRYDAGAWLPVRAATYLAVSVALPVLAALPSDIVLQIFRAGDAAADQRRADSGSAAGPAAGATTATR
jgi:SAM-dependent methyltransferase